MKTNQMKFGGSTNFGQPPSKICESDLADVFRPLS